MFNFEETISSFAREIASIPTTEAVPVLTVHDKVRDYIIIIFVYEINKK